MIDVRNLVPQLKPADWVATFLATLALAVSLWSQWTDRVQNRLALRPHLQIKESFAPSSPRLGVEVMNYGPGMAIVDQFQLYLDGEPIAGDWRQQWSRFRSATDTLEWTNTGALLRGDVLASKTDQAAEILIIVDEGRKDPATWKDVASRINTATERLGVSIRYHSELGEAFEIRKSGHAGAQYRRLDLLGRWVPWTP